MTGQWKTPGNLSCRRGCLFAILPLVISLFLASCGQSGVPPAPVYLKIAGSNAMHTLLSDLINAYVAENPQVSFDLQGGGSDIGLDLLRAGQVDMAATSWFPSEEELNGGDSATRVKVTVIAQDGLGLVVHAKNPVEGLSVAQIRAIFSGHIPDWREVGGRVGDVLVVSREDGSGDRSTFESLIMDRQPVTLGAIVMPDSRDVVEYVGSHPNAIGYVSIAERSPDVKPLIIDGVEPNHENIQDGSYPLWRPLAIISAEQPGPSVKAFLSFVTGPAGKEIIQTRYDSFR